ncbi:MAG: YaiI/YqxD family protein [Planctomycetota bacterium]
MTMRMWVDADAAPREVKEVVFRAAGRLSIDTVLVANVKIDIPPGASTVSAIRVSQGANVADQYIVQHANPGDVAVTADIPLAADLVAKDVHVIDPRGDIYDKDNIRSRLAARDFFESVRSAGEQTSGAPPYSQRDKKAFADALDRTLSRKRDAKPPE